MRFLWATATHRGRVREANEDAVFPESAGESDGPVTLIVADGMGGHVAGEVASRLAINAAASSQLPPAGRVQEANKAIREEVSRQPALAGMGTTMTLAHLDNGNATLAHVGDSRAYIFRRGNLTQLTEDHTVAARYVALGKLDADEVASHPQRHILTRTLGLDMLVDVDEIEITLRPADRLLICSDGLTEMVDDELIAESLAEGAPEDVAWSLVEKANQAGGTDNVTVIVIDVVE